MKKIGFFGLLIFWLLCLGMTVNAALLSPALSVMQDDFEMIKTGVGTNTVSFSQSDFVSVLGSGDFPGIAVQSLPDPSDGILKLGMEDVREGQIIERDMLDALRFIPAEPGKTAVFDFLPCETAYEKPFVCTVYMLDTLNFAPSAQACTVSAKENIAVYGSLSASDPDGDEITYHTSAHPDTASFPFPQTAPSSTPRARARLPTASPITSATATATAPKPPSFPSAPPPTRAGSYTPIWRTANTRFPPPCSRKKAPSSVKRWATNGSSRRIKPSRAPIF